MKSGKTMAKIDLHPCAQPWRQGRQEPRGRSVEDTLRCFIQKPYTTPRQTPNAAYCVVITRLLAISQTPSTTAVSRAGGLIKKPYNHCLAREESTDGHR